MTTLAAFAAASPALGGPATPIPFAAPLEEMCKPEDPCGAISFQLDKKPRDERKVHDIEITDMAAACEGRKGRLKFSIFGYTKVLDDRSFAVRSEDGEGAKAVVRGQFSRKFRRAKGTVRLWGMFDLDDGAGRSKCESGKQKFTATISG